MTKNDFINAVKSQTDAGFLTALIGTALDVLPRAYANNFIYELYATRIYEGQVYTLKHLETSREFHFAGANDVHDFFKSINPRYAKDNLFRVRNKEGRTLYGYEVTCIDKTKETIH